MKLGLASLPQQITHHTILSTTHLLSYLTFAQCSKRKYTSPVKSKSLQHLQHNRSKTIVIWTDSLSTLQALSSKLSRSKTVIHCHEALDELAKHNTCSNNLSGIVVTYVGHWGNERARMQKWGQKNQYIKQGDRA